MKIPSLYVYFQLKMAEKAVEDNYVYKSKIRDMFMRYKIPKKLHGVVIKEMEMFKLLKNENEAIKIINCKHYDAGLEGYTRLTRRRKELEKMSKGKEGFFDF